jgi:hypothetical protein
MIWKNKPEYLKMKCSNFIGIYNVTS